ncbi:hypothetical protein GCM10020000_70700 [Streptomyces olivoverticillatus]
MERGRGSVADRSRLGVALESAVALVEGTARAVRDGENGDAAVASVLVARFAAQQALTTVADLATELLGGMAFITSDDVAYLATAVRPLAFHPPSRGSTAEALADYFAGRPLILS